MKKPSLVDIFITFAKVGTMTFGGGYAMLPILRKEVITSKEWITEEEMMDFYAIAQVTPGIIAINTSALIGYHLRGKAGSMAAGYGSSTPSIVIITIIALFLTNLIEQPMVARMFDAIRIAVSALIVHTAFNLYTKGVKDFIGQIIFLSAFLLIVLLGVSPIWIVLASAISGIIFYPKRGKAK